MANFIMTDELKAVHARAVKELSASPHRYTAPTGYGGELQILDQSISHLPEMAVLAIWDGERHLDLARRNLFVALDNRAPWANERYRLSEIARYRFCRSRALQMIARGLAS